MNVWFPVGEILWKILEGLVSRECLRGLGNMALLEEACHWGGLWFLKPKPGPKAFFLPAAYRSGCKGSSTAPVLCTMIWGLGSWKTVKDEAIE